MRTKPKTRQSKDAAMIGLSFRIPRVLHAKIKQKAQSIERSTSWLIVRTLRNLAESETAAQ